MNKFDQLDAALGNEDLTRSNNSEVVKRLLTPAEWDDVVGGDGYNQGGNYTQTSGSYTQSGSGSHSQTGGGNYTMATPAPSPVTGTP
ncbi:hypothetical protein H8L32_21550 [Undibacterium sp. CY18W]|uniref:Uncharacterized protein n=1 Tax=Undibacterium hunanense TaxID=2762292 RepID=A0ABR6ZW22_9BURK|nr:hypothetical protein [Undibacterium hunanense]MBC3920067.1 hypothetical protein [Undibacterium hunanense]